LFFLSGKNKHRVRARKIAQVRTNPISYIDKIRFNKNSPPHEKPGLRNQTIYSDIHRHRSAVIHDWNVFLLSGL
jgi:hypothetical protein